MDEVELEVPYYYEEISDADYRMFGKIGSQAEGVIEFEFYAGKKGKEVNIEKYYDPATQLDYILKYCTESTKEKFEDAKQEALDFFK